jgi:hypothetical protein
MSKATVKATRREPRTEHRRRRRKRKNKLVRFSSLGHFLRACTLLPQPRVVRNDEFPSWKSLFFYCCADAILFAPLKSQGVDSRLNHIREKTTAAAPPPCSPKSIYVLASLVSIPSIEYIMNRTDTSDQARDSAPL